MWKCPKCGRTFKKENQGHYCGKAPKTIDEYINTQDEEFRSQLYAVREALKKSLPDAAEKIAWSMPTYWQGGNIIHSENLPLELISEIAEWCRETGNHA